MISGTGKRSLLSRFVTLVGAALVVSLLLVGTSACRSDDAPPDPTLVAAFDVSGTLLDLSVTEDASYAAFITDAGAYSLDLETGEQREIPISDYMDTSGNEGGESGAAECAASFVPLDNERVIILQDGYPVRVFNYEDGSLVTLEALDGMNVTMCMPTKDASKLRCFAAGDIDVNASGDIYLSESPRLVVCSADGKELLADAVLPFNLEKEELSNFYISDDCTLGYATRFIYETEDRELITIDLASGQILATESLAGQSGPGDAICELDDGVVLCGRSSESDVWRYDYKSNESVRIGGPDDIAVVNSEYYGNNDYHNPQEHRKTTLMIASDRYNSLFDDDEGAGLYDALDFSSLLDNEAVLDDVEIVAYDNMTGEKLWSSPCRARVLYDLLFANLGTMDISTSQATSDGRYLYIWGYVNGYDFANPDGPFHNVEMASLGMVVLDTKTGALTEHTTLRMFGDDPNDPEYEELDVSPEGGHAPRWANYLVLADNDEKMVAVDRPTGSVGVYDTNITGSGTSLMGDLPLEKTWLIIALIVVALLAVMAAIVVVTASRRRHRRAAGSDRHDVGLAHPEKSNGRRSGTQYCPWCGCHLGTRGGSFCPCCGKRISSDGRLS